MNVLERGSQHDTDLQSVLSFVTWSLEKLQLTLAVLCKALYHFPPKKGFCETSRSKGGSTNAIHFESRTNARTDVRTEVGAEVISLPKRMGTYASTETPRPRPGHGAKGRKWQSSSQNTNPIVKQSIKPSSK